MEFRMLGPLEAASNGAPLALGGVKQRATLGFLLLPLRDNAGDALGVIAAARDFSGTRAAASRSLIWQICLAVFATVILSGVIIVVLRGFLLRPLEVLDARFAAMAAGERTTAREPTDKFCPEIQRVAANYERVLAARPHDEHRP